MEKLMRTKIIGVLALAALVGCSSGRRTPDSMATAQFAVGEARRANAAQFAPSELQLAEQKLRDAEAAVEEEEYAKARILSEQSAVDAQVALSKSEAEKAWKEALETKQIVGGNPSAVVIIGDK